MPNGKGYIQVKVDGVQHSAHRLVYEHHHGIIPKDLVVDHTCRNRSCCNINHLRTVTQRVNVTENVEGMAWQLNAIKTHCPQGHPYSGTNLYVPPPNNHQSVARRCRQCAKDNARSWYHRRSSIVS